MLLAGLTLFALGLALYPIVALFMIFGQRQGPRPVSRSRKFAEDIQRPPDRTIPISQVPMRDGWAMPVRFLPGPDGGPLLILLHGSGWHGQQLEDLALRLGDAARVVVPDLRGHGAAPERRGDVDYLGQVEDDLADLIGALGGVGQPVIVAGHSSGAGTAIRFCGGRYRGRADAAVLLAPYLRHDAPTHYPGRNGWADLMTLRLAGLEMLNAIGIHWLDHLPVVQFAMPQAVIDGPEGHTATLGYSHRLNASLLPRRRWWRDVARLPQFVLVAGAADRAFRAEAFASTFKAVTDRGTYHLLPGVGHPDVVHSPRTEAAIRTLIADVRRPEPLCQPRSEGRPRAVPRDHGVAGACPVAPVPDLRLQHRGVARPLDDA